MAYQALQNTPLQISLLDAARQTGWTIAGNIATHEACNAGNLTNNTYVIVPGLSYTFTYLIMSISGGQVQPKLGGANGVSQTTTGFKTDTIVATNNSPLLFFSDANMSMQTFTIQPTPIAQTSYITNTIAYAELLNKWTSYYTFVPDKGFSMFTDTFTFNQGSMYRHQHGTNNRGNFYGVQFAWKLKFVENQNATIAKTYEALAYQANTLLVTTPAGITTSLGQLSELMAIDFLQFTLQDGSTTVNVYTKDGLYSATLLRDMNDNINTGDFLKGNYMLVEMTNQTPTDAVELFTIDIKSSKSFNNIR
ncbi:MAG: hypothetical protein JWQ09_5875 [Segetibacter sp.]|nr:hypothetical protein [Segetibacter sp.]